MLRTTTYCATGRALINQGNIIPTFRRTGCGDVAHLVYHVVKWFVQLARVPRVDKAAEEHRRLEGHSSTQRLQ